MIVSNTLVITSEVDEAGMNIVNKLMSLIDFYDKKIEVPNSWLDGSYKYYNSDKIDLLILSNPHYQADYLSEGIIAKLVIFASKHLSKAGQKAILVHSLGNWDEARHGSGKDRSIAFSSPKAMYQGYHSLLKQQELHNLGHYWVGVEATHHGPTELNSPVVFFEVGGTEEEWKDLEACEVVAKAIIDTIQNYESIEIPVAIGVGGTHYARAFIERMDAKLFAISHIIPKYVMKSLTKDLLQQTWIKSPGENKIFLIDKSGTRSKERKRLLEFLEELNYPYAMVSDYPVDT